MSCVAHITQRVITAALLMLLLSVWKLLDFMQVIQKSWYNKVKNPQIYLTSLSSIYLLQHLTCICFIPQNTSTVYILVFKCMINHRLLLWLGQLHFSIDSTTYHTRQPIVQLCHTLNTAACKKTRCLTVSLSAEDKSSP